MDNLFPTRRNRALEKLMDLESILNDFWSNDFPLFEKGVKLPKMNMKESKSKYVIEAAVPGMKKEDIELTVEDNVLYITGHLEEQKITEDDDECYVVRELSHRSFRRAIPFKDRILHTVKAKIKEGILKIEVLKDKAGHEKSSKIEIKEEE